MTQLVWDQVGQRVYETGVDHGVLYIPNNLGVYENGYAWNGLTTVTESPSGAEANPQYADNIKYLNLLSAEEFGATIEAFTYPDEFAQCDGSVEPQPGVIIEQQPRKTFGFSYRTKVANDLNPEAGYKLHVVYGALAAPSEKARATVNDSPEAVAFSWDVTTSPVPVTGYKPTAHMVFNSTKVGAAGLAALEQALYGTSGADPHLPTPDEILAMFAGSVTTVETVAPTYNASTDIITIPTVTGVEYYVNGELVTGTVGPITADTVVTARPAAGYKFTPESDDDWTINFA
jgi:hypothetical protein